MRIAMSSDHAGLSLKTTLVAYARSLGHEVQDLGTHTPEPVDYPDFSEAVGKALLDGSAERGIVVCGSGVGASVAANKMPGIRAGLCHDTYSAAQGVEHDDMNVLVLGARIIGPALAHELNYADEHSFMVLQARKMIGIVRQIDNSFPSSTGVFPGGYHEVDCITCHRGDATARGPNLAGVYGSTVLLSDGRKITADDGYIRESIQNPPAKVVAGFQPIMPTFQGQVSEEQLLALTEYIKSLPALQQAPGAHATPPATAPPSDSASALNARSSVRIAMGLSP
jgi:ribose 5-phosphate isomerase B